MKTEVKEISPTQKELHLEVPAEAVKEVYNRVTQKIARSVNIPGFRKGFAPVDVVKMRYKEDIKNQVFQELLPKVVSAAFEENELNPLGEPQMHIEDVENVKVNGSQPISLRVHFEVMPEIEVPNYVGLEATRRIRPVKDEEMERIINERLQQSASLIPVEDRKSQEGDTLIVDLEGTFIDKPEEEPIKADDLELTLGEANIEKAFTENLIGLEEDDEKEFTVEYPEDFGSQFLAGQKVSYKAKVKSVGKIELPEADDEWAQGLEEEFKSMKDLRKKLREDLELMAKNEADNKIKDELVTKLIDEHPIEVPQILINIQARTILENFAQDLAQQGMDLNKMETDFVRSLYEQMRGQAERDVRGAILLEKVAELENVEVTSEEIAEEIERMAAYYRVTPEQIRTSLSQQQGGENSIADRLRSRKSVEKLLEKSKITDGEWIDENAAEAVAEAGAEAEPVSEEKEEKPKAKKARKKSE
jgi:trigger factor